MMPAPRTEVSRPLSAIEYFHAATGQSPATLEPPREVIFCVEGRGRLIEAAVRAAVDVVNATHPGLRLRIVGKRRGARFESDGAAAPLRFVRDSVWDGLSQRGSEFLRATPLPFETGPMSEWIVEELTDGRTRIWLRASHAAMDGLGVMHGLAELFRVLRGEPLAGDNASGSDTELMRAQRAPAPAKGDAPPLGRCAQLTGAPEGDATGNVWRRIALNGRRPNSLYRLVGAFNDFARRHDANLPVLFALPVNLRRHVEGLVSTRNFTSMLHVALQPGEGVEDFKRKWNANLQAKRDAHYSGQAEIFRRLPFAWLDWLLHRRRGNYRGKRLLETAAISHLGYFRTAHYSCEGYRAERVWGVPLPGSAFTLVFGTEKSLDVIVGLPETYAEGGRFEALQTHLARALEN